MLCWRAPKEHRDAVNAVKELGNKPTEKRVLPESPDQTEPWVIRYKMRRLGKNPEKEDELSQKLQQMAAQQRMVKDAEEYERDIKVDPVTVTAGDLDMLKEKYPGAFNIMKSLAGDSEMPMVVVEAQDMKVKDSVAKRTEARMQKALKDLASQAC